MNVDESTLSQPSTGKVKPEPELLSQQESTPLLAASSIIAPETRIHRHRRLRLRSTLTHCLPRNLVRMYRRSFIPAFVAYRYAAKASSSPTTTFSIKGLVLSGPDRINLLNVTKEAAYGFKVDGTSRFDAGCYCWRDVR